MGVPFSPEGDERKIVSSPPWRKREHPGQAETLRTPLIAVNCKSVKGLEKVIVTKLPAVRIVPGLSPQLEKAQGDAE